MNRFDRITAILIQLQSKKVVKAQDLAVRFSISLRTVYRDIRSLEEAGVPVYGEAGIGYSLVDGYRLPPVMFTPDEAIAFITAEKLMGKFSDSTLQNHYNTAMYKVKAVLRGTEKDLLENLEGQIMVTGKTGNSASPGNTLDILLKAITDKKAVAITYRAFGKEQNTERLLEPIGIFHEDDHWHTIGYCHLRNEYRQFRIDRVIDIRLTSTPQEERTSLQEYKQVKERAKAMLALKKIVLRVDKDAAPYMQDRRHYYGFVSEVAGNDHVEMTFLYHLPDEGIARWLMMFADCAEITEPQELKDYVGSILEKYFQKTVLPKKMLT